MLYFFSRFHNWPLARKVSAIVLISSGLLISIMAFAITLEKYLSHRAMLVDNTTMLAALIGANSTAALTFNDASTAEEILSALNAENDIISAVLYTANAKVFTSYIHPAYRDEKVIASASSLRPLQSRQKGGALSQFTSGYFDLLKPILLNKKIIGHISLRTDLTGLNSQLQLFVLVIIGFCLILFGLVGFICSRLTRNIIEPVSQLAETMQEVSCGDSFAVRVTKKHNDEIGVLIDGFNTMLAQIQKRDIEIARHQEGLTELVDIRTQELKLANQQLRIEIRERMETEARLVHAQKMEAIGTLAGGVAHDLNNILSGIVTYPDLLLHNLPTDSPLREPIQTIRSSGKKAAVIVQDLLTLARRGVKVAERIELGSLVKEYLHSPECEELRCAHPQISIQFSERTSDFMMIGSPVHLSKTLMNLVANAAEAIVGSGIISIQLEEIFMSSRPVDFPKWRKGPYIRMNVTDTGSGIAKEDVDRIFEPFYTRKIMGRSGTGLGLSVVWGTVEDHHGYITVASREGEGTTFQLLFPTVDRGNSDIIEPLPSHFQQEELSVGMAPAKR